MSFLPFASVFFILSPTAMETQAEAASGTETYRPRCDWSLRVYGCPSPIITSPPRPLIPLGAPVKNWCYGNYSTGPFNCVNEYDYPAANGTSDGVWKWTMLSSYRSGGLENVHWKYTSDPDDSACLENWSYYNENGTKLISAVKGRTTSQFNDENRSDSADTHVGGILLHVPETKPMWCALPVYRPGGIFGKQFGACDYIAAEDVPIPTTFTYFPPPMVR